MTDVSQAPAVTLSAHTFKKVHIYYKKKKEIFFPNLEFLKMQFIAF